jgi:hypothetical protein
MRDPELMLRAQRAATELERAWDRWRTMHGLGAEPLPPVTSYVGYSLEEPWGQPRVVFGIAAGEAEHLAALLDRHDCAGPVYAAMTSQNARPEPNASGRERGRGVHVPTQAPAGPAARDVAAGPGPQGSRPDPFDPRTAGRLGVAEPDPADGTDGLEDEAEAQDEGQQGLVAFRPRREPAPSHGDVDETAQIEDPSTEAAQAGRPAGGWTRRLPGGHSLPRQKRAGGAAKGASSKQQEGKDRADLTDLSAELAGWDAGELPGEASHRRVQRPPGRPDRPAL